MARMIPLLLLALAPFAGAQETPQISWVGEWEKAFAEARDTERPVMVCINSKDGEIANERTAKEIYRDREFVELSKSFVMVAVSVPTHGKGTCPRFGGITCKQHFECWKELKASHGNQFMTEEGGGGMISPQHAWFRPDGTLLRRKEYWLDKPELLRRMRAVLDELSGKAVPPGAGEETPPPGDSKDVPLTDKDKSELERVKTGDKESRGAALGNLLETEKRAVYAELVLMLQSKGNTERKCAVLAAIGKARALDLRFAVEERLQDPDELIRSFAAVAVERLGQKESVEPLLKRVRKERDTPARRNMARALGVCGGGAADKEAAKQLLKMLKADKQNVVRKHAALALRHYEGPGAPLVLPALEKEALKVKDRTVRSGVVYTLAFIGNVATTLPVLRKILEKQHDEYGERYIRSAISILETGSGDFGRALWWVFAEDREDPARE